MGLPHAARTQVERVFPRGAIILSVLAFAFLVMGIIRNRVFANTYGAGAELDAYNAAFRIPEVALDVLVAAGVTAPFVPIFSRQRRDDADDAAANEFGRTVLTAAVGMTAIASVLIFVGAGWLATVIGETFETSTRDLYIQLVRINCLAQLISVTDSESRRRLGVPSPARRRCSACEPSARPRRRSASGPRSPSGRPPFASSSA